MTDIVFSRSYRSGKSIMRSASPKGSRWIEENMAVKLGNVQVTVDTESVPELQKDLEKDGLTVQVN